jgi:hypothetical protein
MDYLTLLSAKTSQKIYDDVYHLLEEYRSANNNNNDDRGRGKNLRMGSFCSLQRIICDRQIVGFKLNEISSSVCDCDGHEKEEKSHIGHEEGRILREIPQSLLQLKSFQQKQQMISIFLKCLKTILFSIHSSRYSSPPSPSSSLMALVPGAGVNEMLWSVFWELTARELGILSFASSSSSSPSSSSNQEIPYSTPLQRISESFARKLFLTSQENAGRSYHLELVEYCSALSYAMESIPLALLSSTMNFIRFSNTKNEDNRIHFPSFPIQRERIRIHSSSNPKHILLEWKGIVLEGLKTTEEANHDNHNNHFNCFGLICIPQEETRELSFKWDSVDSNKVYSSAAVFQDSKIFLFIPLSIFFFFFFNHFFLCSCVLNSGTASNLFKSGLCYSNKV